MILCNTKDIVACGIFRYLNHEKEHNYKDFVWIALQVAILPIVKIGNGSTISAEVLVSDVPDYSMVAGTPAHVIK